MLILGSLGIYSVPEIAEKLERSCRRASPDTIVLTAFHVRTRANRVTRRAYGVLCTCMSHTRRQPKIVEIGKGREGVPLDAHSKIPEVHGTRNGAPIIMKVDVKDVVEIMSSTNVRGRRTIQLSSAQRHSGHGY